MDIQDLLRSFNNHICLSGGAVGSDLHWGEMAKRAGHSIIHWSFEGHNTFAPPNEIIRLTTDQLIKADPALQRANKAVKRRFPGANELTNNLLRRNWYQVAWTDSVYAVATIGLDHTISGGTSWAVQLYLDRFLYDNEDIEKCKLYVFDMNQSVWWSWKQRWQIMQAPPPQPTGLWTGIGKRKLNNAGKWEINKMFGGYPLTSQVISNVFPVVTVPKIGDIIYVNDVKIRGKGIDNSIGGWAKIQNIQQGSGKTFISVAELSGRFFCWDDLKPQQEHLRDLYGMQHAQLQPDDSKENNFEIEYYRIK